MHRRFREKVRKTIWMPTELISDIQTAANEKHCSFNRIVVSALLKQFKSKPDKQAKRSKGLKAKIRKITQLIRNGS